MKVQRGGKKGVSSWKFRERESLNEVKEGG